MTGIIRRRICVLAAALVMAMSVALTTTGDEPRPVSDGKIDFQRDVAPILARHCIDCHGPDLQMAELRLDQRKLALADGDARGLIQTGKSGESLLIQRLTDRKLGILMPPSFPFFPGEKAGLSEDKINVLKAWIDQGAAWPDEAVLAAPSQAKNEDPKLPALFAAIRAGDHAAVSKLLDKTRASARDHEGATPLMHAASFADAKMLQVLLDAGADVNVASPSGATALMRGAGDPEKVKLLLAAGANASARSEMGRTPLLVAASYAGNLESVRLLIAAGAKISDQDLMGETCLTSACKRGDAEMAAALIEAGADLTAGGRPPLVWAAEEGNLETIRCLLAHGAGKVPPVLNAALSSAAGRGPVETVQLLLENGADPNAPSMIAGYTPLMWAAYSENVSVETVKLLLEKGAKIDAKAANGETPLSLAQKRGHTDIVKLLGGADPSQTAESAAPSEKPQPHADADQIRAAAEKGLALLQKTGPTFFTQSGCVACHQQTVASLAVAEARQRGLKLDDATAREQLKITALTSQSYRERFLQRVDHPAGSAPSVGYLLLGMAAESYPADETTDAMILELAGRQQTDGSWTAFGHRPPIEYSRIGATALALRALTQYGPPGLKEPLAERIDRARKWLLAAQPLSNAEHAYRLLGLVWADADQEQIAGQVASLQKSQRAGGGWSQVETLESDAFATGLALYALHAAGLETSHASYRRGVDFVVRTQQDDGSWHVKTHSFPFQPYFESGFPHGHDQWISAMATGLATVSLLEALPPAEKVGQVGAR
jgi:ankyrin repeat protein